MKGRLIVLEEERQRRLIVFEEEKRRIKWKYIIKILIVI
jgi:hypothetical protein